MKRKVITFGILLCLVCSSMLVASCENWFDFLRRGNRTGEQADPIQPGEREDDQNGYLVLYNSSDYSIAASLYQGSNLLKEIGTIYGEDHIEWEFKFTRPANNMRIDVVNINSGDVDTLSFSLGSDPYVVFQYYYDYYTSRFVLSQF